MTTSLADRLATFALQTRFEDLPAEVVFEAKRRLLDTLGCAVGARDEPAPLIARRAAAQIGAQSGVTLIGGGSSAADWGG